MKFFCFFCLVLLLGGCALQNPVTSENMGDKFYSFVDSMLDQHAHKQVGKTVTVAAGDTIIKLANRYSTTKEQIASLNYLKYPYIIHPGQSLLVPDQNQNTSDGGQPVASDQSKSIRSQSLPSPHGTTSSSKKQSPALSQSFIWPLKGKIIQRFGTSKNGKRNDGINIAAPYRTPIKAVESGEVLYIGDILKGYGNLTIIKHENNWLTAYAHQSSMSARKGDYVKKGQVIGYVGSTGNVNGQNQLHFVLRQNKKPVDPVVHLH